ncbi:3-phosphoshikimate 1-carboxyvinyltransferase [Abditibacterium utsteinense]|uniref:3-phosphoshikimate 1-carboxyvinyltransferase n=1 Tax=Abditibacterium utsteinense TaxID=1960156 RepID=A0A2S8SRQ7_9BACT|nr:3-phosphoshikimate 1-carboxyvinyltransferase [Abditibacterium utsteinense]PQV63493.1 3-phosphoshikimate 1-carboxyvinyltransferase [Abditibacterium utsteinense]
MSALPIHPVSHPIEGTIRVPGSKSITNRALLLAALCDGPSKLEGALFSDDTRYMEAALNQLGVAVRGDEKAATYEIEGRGGTFPNPEAELFLGNAGTATRFLTAALCLGNGTYFVDGIPRMRQRPIGDLLGALRTLGAEILSHNDCVPLEIRARGLQGGAVSIRGDASSQFLSALLLVAPKTRDGLEISIDGPLFSKPYVEMTLQMLRQWGAAAQHEELQRFHVPGNQSLRAQNYIVEPDASSASYFFAAAAVTGGKIRVKNLGKNALQGDVEFVDVLQKMGCTIKKAENYIEVKGPEGGKLHGVCVDMNAISDCVPTLAAIAPFADAPVEISNVAHIRGKETDRIAALAKELGRLGAKVDEKPDGLTIFPAKKLKRAAIKTYDDHRMAMSFAITALRSPGIEIRDPGCVAKTFPDFFERLEKLCQKAR